MRFIRFLFALYQWLIAFPILLASTILTATFTMLLTPWANTKFAYLFARIWARLFCILLFVKVNVSGLEHINPKQSYIFVCNHQSIYDVFVIYGWLPVFFKWMMKIELRKIPLVGRACVSAGHIFINRTSPKAAQRSIAEAERRLTNGISLVIFPEGTRTSTGKVGAFKRGAFMLASDLKLPIIPISLTGCYERLKRGVFTVSPGRITMKVHAPIDIAPYLPDKQHELMKKAREIIISGIEKAQD